MDSFILAIVQCFYRSSSAASCLLTERFSFHSLPIMDLPTPSQDEPRILLPLAINVSSGAAHSEIGMPLGSGHGLRPHPTSTEPLPCVTTAFATSEPVHLNPIPLPPPDPTQVSTLPTPFSEGLPDLKSLISSGAEGIPPLTPPLTSRGTKISTRDLQLPSFRELGIAAPHSYRDIPHFEPFHLLETVPSSWPPVSGYSADGKVLAGFFGGPSPSLSSDDIPALSSQSSHHRFILTTTPPADSNLTSMSGMPGIPNIVEGLGDMTMNAPIEASAPSDVDYDATSTEQNAPTNFMSPPSVLSTLRKLPVSVTFAI